MPSLPSHQTRAQRMDRFMAFTISGGGILIIGAVLAMLLFILKEALPLFAPATVKRAGTVQAAPSDGAWLDESGKAAVLASRTGGLSALRLPEGTALPVPSEGPALPWRALLPPDTRGETLVIGVDGRMSVARLAWSKPAGENDPAQWTLEPHWQGGIPLKAFPEAILHFRLLGGGGLDGGQTLRVVARFPEGLAWLETPLDATSAPAWAP
ncbi:MAG TPA: hypothetical protein VK150_08290, partial [Geothrix sp.]|nr:hypothetical protein [Geothrix sp.]